MQGFLAPGVHFAAAPPTAGVGLFGHVPLDVQSPEDGLATSRAGVRYASQNLSAGVTLQPFTSAVENAWLLFRHRPEGTEATHVTFGCQVKPQTTIGDVLSRRSALKDVMRPDNVSSFFQYQSGGKDSYFTLTVEALAVCLRLDTHVCKCGPSLNAQA